MSDVIENVSVSLGSYDRALLQNHVENGRFASRSEVVRAGLRMLDDYEHNQKLQRLRAEIAKGDADYEAGRYREYDSVETLIGEITGASDHS